MIEDGLFLALGFCLATLIAIACLPLVWSRALHRTRERLARIVPSSQAEIDAVHDGLRAQAAVTHRRLEQRIETGQHEAAAIKVELGRRTVGLVAAESLSAGLQAERGALLGELAHQQRDLRDVEGQRVALEKALHDADTKAEASSSAKSDAERHLAQARSLGQEQGAAIAQLEARLATLSADIVDGQDRVKAMEAVAAQHATAELAAEAAFEMKRNEADRLKTALASAQESLRQERQQAEEREGRLQQRSAVASAAEAHMVEQDALINRKLADFAALKLRIEALEDALKARADAAVNGPQSVDQQDAHVRNGIVAVGDDALRLLQPSDGAREPVEGTAAGQGGGDHP